MAKLKNKLNYILALLATTFSGSAFTQEAESAGSEEEAAKEASGSLSAGQIAAAPRRKRTPRKGSLSGGKSQRPPLSLLCWLESSCWSE